MNEWPLMVRKLCSPDPGDEVLNGIKGNEYRLRILSEYRLPKVTELIIGDPEILRKDWASCYKPYAELYERWNQAAGDNDRNSLIEWLIQKTEENHGFLENSIFPFISTEFANQILEKIDLKTGELQKESSSWDEYTKEFIKFLESSYKKKATGVLEKDIINHLPCKAEPPYFEILRAEWSKRLSPEACIPSECMDDKNAPCTSDHGINDDSAQGEAVPSESAQPVKKKNRKINKDDIVQFTMLVEALTDHACKKQEERIAKLGRVSQRFLAWIENLPNDIEDRRKKAETEITDEESYFPSACAEYWGYSSDIEDDMLSETLDSIYCEAKDAAKTLAALLCFEKDENSRLRLLEQIKNAMLNCRISLDLSKIYYCIQSSPWKSDDVIKQVISLQDSLACQAVQLAKKNRKLADESSKRYKELHEKIGPPITDIERTLTCFLSWKSYDDRKFQHFFQRCRQQVARLREKLTAFGLEPVISPQDWVDQCAIPFDPEKHRGQSKPGQVIAKTMGFAYMDEFEEQKIVCAEVTDAPASEVSTTDANKGDMKEEFHGA